MLCKEDLKTFLATLNIPEPFYCEAAWNDYVLQMTIVPDFTIICTKKVKGEALVSVFKEEKDKPSDVFREFIKGVF